MRASLRGPALLGGAIPVFAACSDGSAPLGKGDVLHMDVDASSMTADPGDGAVAADSPFSPLDGPYGPSDAYAPLALCTQCSCDAATFCYGGSPSSTLSACDQTASPGLEPGCHTIPAACAGSPACVCLLEALPRPMSCYPVCQSGAGGGLIVYCPR